MLWLNTEAMQAYWTANAAAAPYSSLDVDAAPTGSDDPYSNLKQRFGVARNVVATAAVIEGAEDGGNVAVLEVYHAGLVAPFCLEAAGDFFAAHP